MTLPSDADGLRPVSDAIATGTGSVEGPFVTGLTGGVGSGKTEMARAFAELLGDDHGLRATVVSSDGFLYSNAKLDELGLMHRKGFTDSYDATAIRTFLTSVRSGGAVEVPVYDHFVSDVVDATETIVPGAVVIFEGVNVLHFADALNMGVYVDAAEPDMRRWYLQRVLALREKSREDPSPFFSAYADLGDEEFAAATLAVWESVNLRNLAECIEPTRAHADVVVTKAGDHSVASIEFR